MLSKLPSNRMSGVPTWLKNTPSMTLVFLRKVCLSRTDSSRSITTVTNSTWTNRKATSMSR